MIKDFVLLLQFMTRIPVPFRVEFNEERFGKSTAMMPLVGLLIGIGLWSVLQGLIYLKLNSMVIATLLVITEIIITGGLHLDGLADTFDGIFSYRSRDRILEIMKDSRLGTNGALALITFIILKTGFLLDINSRFLIIMPMLARMNVSWIACLFPYARQKGMANPFITYSGWLQTIIATIFTTAVSIFLMGITGLLFVVIAILFALIFNLYLKQKIGGVTGDTFGATIELTSLCVLIAGVLLQ